MTLPTANLVFLWHFHQPEYRDAGGRFAQPWAYLHALKDCTDLAAHLERHPSVRSIFNVSGVFLDQLADYASQCATGTWRDPLLQLLASPERALTEAERLYIADQCLRINRASMVRPYAGFAAIERETAAAEQGGPSFWTRFDDALFNDLLTWYHIAWCGESLKREDPTVRALMAKGRGFDAADRAALLEVVRNALTGLLPRWRALAERGQLEFSVTPYGHPIAPLLVDFAAAHAAHPGVPLPAAPAYPGGAARLHWHLKRAIELCREHLGRSPQGMWPAEAAVSCEVIEAAEALGLRWVLSNDTVLRASRCALSDAADAMQCWTLTEHAPRLFFRNQEISDRMAFEYGQRPAQEAVKHLLDAVRRELAGAKPGAVMSLALDGENAWEFYPDNAWDFFDSLYTALEDAPDLSTTTYSALVNSVQPVPLAALVPGSWVLEGFSMWIGDERRNRAWDALVTLKTAFDARLPHLDPVAQANASLRLARCEASDWLWWLGFDEPRSSVCDFDAQFRQALAEAWLALGIAPPADSQRPLSRLGQFHDRAPSVHRIARALADLEGATLTARLPDGPVEWTLCTPCPQLDALLSGISGTGWSFLVPWYGAVDEDISDAFKYAEIRIALEKAELRYFEGQAKLSSGAAYPALLALGADTDVARHLAQRFRLAVVACGAVGEAGRLVVAS